MIGVESVERAILSAFLFHGTMDFHKSEDVFNLNINFFNGNFNKRLVENINYAISKGETNFQLLQTQIEDKVAGTKFELDFINVLAQSPMGLDLAKRYHDEFLGDKYQKKAFFEGAA